MPFTRRYPRLHYQTLGAQGSPVLLVMGFGMHAEAWKPQREALAKQHQVCVYDHPGIGQSRPLGRLPTMKDYAQMADGLLDELQWDRAHIVGVSMGGMIAQHIAINHPERLRSLTLIATHPGGRGRFPTAEGLRHWYEGNTADSPDSRIQALKRLLYTPEFLDKFDREIHERMVNSFGERAPRSALMEQFHAILRHNTRRQLSQIKAPTLVIRPDQDLLIRPNNSDLLHRRIPNARLVQIEDAGHGVTFEAKDRVNATILEHLARIDAA